MTAIAFYRQKRFDDGIRTGVEVNGQRLLEDFEEGDPEYDPSLLWYIDLDFEGPSLPTGAEEVRQWLQSQARFVHASLADVAENNLGLGFDAEFRPLKRTYRLHANEGELTVTVSAVHRLTAREMADEVRDLGQHWGSVLGRLQPLSYV